ncbi:hypothetical protein GCM10010168_03690 [Actinoplanes ianthinogenes]|uniref:PH domain-containing protein n=1 Tax=Actinoplanes ianthinogenes TaxID=122358 RepID=A0ABM7LUD4_9ACTN|nr:hypothetical protein [Actinoplanes ianthinogenes]BCJ42891.1 hypothetical protein Aiant_35480 [Actinoplanes ianthinogenes]GGQ91574.1 hypothetical protein GCM10010168_03690 [Actinoplanes ianthinogenes]
MPIAPEEVEAPAGDTVLFRSSPARTFVAVFAVLMVSYLLVSPIVSRLARGSGDPWWVTAAQAVVVGAAVAACYSLSARAALTTWVRVSAGGLELAAQGSDPVLLAWPDVAAVTVRRSGLRTVLEVVPVDMDAVHPVQGSGAGWPAVAVTERGQAFVADLTQIWPGPRALRHELVRRLHPYPQPAAAVRPPQPW